MNRYLAALPNGLDSYPQCAMKGSVVRFLIAKLPEKHLLEELPEPLRELATFPPLPTAWVREVHASALTVYLTWAVFGSEDALVTQAYKDNLSLLDSVAYRILFRFVGAHRLLPQVASRWSLFHQGTELTVVEKARPHEGGVVRLKTPPHHVPSVLAKAYSTAFRAAVEIAGGRNATMETRVVDATTIEYRGRWE
ncbi:MAG: hypothetical protein U0269_21940 [Polyangiales bacterium]